MASRQIGLYIHIPFCAKKCVYCDFLSFGACPNEEKEGYVLSLKQELAAWSRRLSADVEVTSLFVGGGTPSCLEAKLLLSILEDVFRLFTVSPDAEITVEANPGTISREILLTYRQAGVNRMSFGFQSLDSTVLSFLGRIHSPEDCYHAVAWARQAGFTNLNGDLIFGVPGQSVASYVHSLQNMVSWELPHISAYSLLVEPGTPLFEGIEAGTIPEPEEDIDREMYRAGQAFLQGEGYVQYELSNFSLPGYGCRHNQRYWTCDEYLGVGLGAASYMLDPVSGLYRRWKNDSDPARYADAVKAFLPSDSWFEENLLLSIEEQKKEFMMLGFRQMEGPDPVAYKKRFGVAQEADFGPVLQRLLERGLVKRAGEHWCLSSQGEDLANQVFLEFV